MTCLPEKTIVIPANTEINSGPSEDSESIVLQKPFKAIIAGEETGGAIPVKIITDDGIEDQVRYFHQPPKTKAKA